MMQSAGTGGVTVGKAFTALNFQALPDDGQVAVKISENGTPGPLFPSRLAVPAAVRAEISRTTLKLWYPRQGQPHPQDAAWIINTCADADEYRNALIWLDDTYGGTAPIFNHPRALARARRDHSSRQLQGIAELKVPRVARVIASSRAAFERCFEENDFRFPVLVRPRAGQTGLGLIRIDGPGDWHRAVNTRWFGQPHFMAEFVDFATEERLYVKARVLFVGERFFIRHVKVSTGWKVHNESSVSAAGSQERENELVQSLSENAAFTRACAAIPGRTGLDFCGMDVGVDPARNRFVMFECNPAMSVFFMDRPTTDPEVLARRSRMEVPAATAFEDHFRNPDSWMWRKVPAADGWKAVPCRELLKD